MLGDVGQPLGVRRPGGEVPFDEVVVDRRSGLAVAAAFLRVQREDLLHRAQPPDPVLARHNALFGEFVGDEPVPVAGIVAVDLQGSVDQMRVVPVPLGDRVRQPLVVPLGGQPQDPARHRDRHPDRGAARGHLTDEREDYFPGRLACER